MGSETNRKVPPRIVARPLAWHLAYLCATLVSPALILAALSAWFYVRAEDTAFTQRQGEFAHIAAASLEGELHRLMNSTVELTRSESLLDQDIPRFRRHVMASQLSTTATVVGYDASGNRFLDTDKNAGAAGSDEDFSTLRERLRLTAGPVIVSRPRPGTWGSDIRIEIRTTVRNNETNYLVVIVPGENLSGLLLPEPLPAKWAVTVIDPAHRVVLQTPLPDCLDCPPRSETLNSITLVQAGTTELTPDTLGANRVVVAASKIPTGGFTVLVTAPADEASAPLQETLLLFSGFSILMLCLSGISAILYSRRIAIPVTRLMGEAQRLGRGESFRVPEGLVAELNAVAQALAEAGRQRLLAEDRLRQSEARFKTLFELAPVPMVLIDAQTLRFTAFNERACELLGHSPEELENLRISDIDPGVTEPDFEAMKYRIKTSSMPVEFETQHRTASGATMDVAVRVRQVRIDGKPFSCAAWFDLTDWHAQQREVRRMANLQAAILNALPAMIALLDDNGCIAAINQAWLERRRSSPREAQRFAGLGTDYLAANRPFAENGDPAAQVILDKLPLILDGTTDKVELVYPLAEPGQPTRWFQFIAVPDSEGQKTRTETGANEMATARRNGAVVMHIDITNRILAEQRLTENEARQRLFFERAPTAIAVFDNDMRYLVASRRFVQDYQLETLGLSVATIIGRSHYDVFPNLPEEWHSIHQRVLNGETLSEEERAFPRSDNRVDWVRWEMVPWRRQDGSIGGAILLSEMVTERKLAKTALQESEARLRLAIEAAELGTWDQDLASGTVILNEGTCRIFGIPSDSLSVDPDTWHARIHPADRASVENGLKMARSGNTLFQTAHRIVRPNGETRWLHPLGRFLPGDATQADRFVSVFSDVTEEMHDSEMRDRLLLLIERSSDFIATTDRDWRMTYVNSSGRSMIGLKPDADISASGFADHAAPDFHDFLEKVVLPTARDTGMWKGQMQLRNLRSGQLIDVQRTIFALPDRDGTLTGYASVTRDITMEKRAAAALEEREARLRAILGSLPDALIVIDADGLIETFGGGAAAIFGWTAEEVIGNPIAMLLSPASGVASMQTVKDMFGLAVPGRPASPAMIQAQRKDGSAFAADVSVADIEANQRTQFVVFFRDLSEQQATQARLQTLQSDVLHASRLSSASAMVAGLAHELNQPLTAATSATRAAQRYLDQPPFDALPTGLREALNFAAEQTLRAGDIVHRLRDFLEPRGPSNKRIEKPHQLVDEACGFALLGIKELGITAKIRVARDLPGIAVDRIQIQQVLVNLIRNAIQAMTEHPGGESDMTSRRELRITAGRSPGGVVKISIADTGSGLAPDVADRLFEPFVSTKEHGMGVGLSICRAIVEAHDGRIWAEPNAGGGTTFRFTVPAAPATACQEQSHEPHG
ncbi:MAG TPA: PAS domain S-box protein [Rhodopila sp.]|nr:PAS domain S-box protein [Rhodopila sp.]